MLVWKKSSAGTIRETNQDVLVINEEAGILVAADGSGPDGAELARLAAVELERALVHLNLAARPDLAGDQLRAVLEELPTKIPGWQFQDPTFSRSPLNICCAFIVEGNLFMGRIGSCGILAGAGGSLHRLEPVNLPTLAVAIGQDPDPGRKLQVPMETRPGILGPIALSVGDWVMVFTQGLLISQPLEEVVPFAEKISEEPDAVAEFLFQRSSGRFDGEDRTLGFMRFLPADLRKRRSDDVVISVDLDRQFRVPLWAPLLCLLALAGILWKLLDYILPDDD